MIEKEKLIAIVGAENVSSDQATLKEYSGDISFINKMKPNYVVRVKKTAEVEKLVKLANATLTPLVPVSSGPPHFRGDTVPSTGGAIVVDLSGMKKIVRVDRANRVALFEAGVTFGELIPQATKAGIRLNMPLLPRKTKSILGSMLEREPVTMPKYHWDISDPIGSTEVVFGSGDLFRTGAASGSGTLKEQWAAGGAQKEAAGPGSASYHRLIQGAQGTMGIVTWATARCELLPHLEEPFLAGSAELDRLLEMVHWLIRLRLVNECFILNNTNLAAIMAEKQADSSRIKEGLPTWVLFFTIAAYQYFPEDRIKGQERDMQRVAQRTGVEAVKALGKIAAADLLEMVKKPSAEPYWKLRPAGGCEDIFFLTIFDKLPALIGTMYEDAGKAGYPASALGIYLQPIVQGVNLHCEFNLFYNPDNAVEANRIKQLTASATRNLLDKGAFFSRPYGEAARMIMNRDAASVAALKKVKAIFDPNNIMNPGKLCF